MPDMDTERSAIRAALSPDAPFPRKLVVTIDKTLKSRGRLARARNVLTRDERIAKLQFEDRWSEEQSPFGLPKVRVIKATTGKKKKKKEASDEEAEGEPETETETK